MGQVQVGQAAGETGAGETGAGETGTGETGFGQFDGKKRPLTRVLVLCVTDVHTAGCWAVMHSWNVCIFLFPL